MGGGGEEEREMGERKGEREGKRGEREKGREGEDLAEARPQPLPLPLQFPNTEPQSWEGGVPRECILTWERHCKDWKPSSVMSSTVTIG